MLTVLSVMLFFPGLGLLIAWLVLLLRRRKEAKVLGLTLLGVSVASIGLCGLAERELSSGIVISWLLMAAAGLAVAWIACLIRRDRLARTTGLAALGALFLLFTFASAMVALMTPEERQALEEARQARAAQQALQRAEARQEKEAERLRRAEQRAAEERAAQHTRQQEEETRAREQAEERRIAELRGIAEAEQQEAERQARERAEQRAAEKRAAAQAQQREAERLAQGRAQRSAPASPSPGQQPFRLTSEVLSAYCRQADGMVEAWVAAGPSGSPPRVVLPPQVRIADIEALWGPYNYTDGYAVAWHIHFDSAGQAIPRRNLPRGISTHGATFFAYGADGRLQLMVVLYDPIFR